MTMTEEEQIQADIERFEQRSCDIPDDGDMVEQVPLFSSSDMQSVIEDGKRKPPIHSLWAIFGGRTSLCSSLLTAVSESPF